MARSRNLIVAADGDLIVQRDVDRPSGRLLRQDDMDASYVDLADARHLEFDYLRWARLALRAFTARRVIHVGGAACALARAMLAEDPGSHQEVIEVDQRVIEIARAHLGLRRQPGLKVRIADGREFLGSRADASADAIVIDAFIGARIPAHLISAPALTDCARVAPVTIINVVDTAGWPQARAIAVPLAQAYPSVLALCPAVRRSGNVLLIGSSAISPAISDAISGSSGRGLGHTLIGKLQSAAASDPSPARLLRL